MHRDLPGSTVRPARWGPCRATPGPPTVDRRQRHPLRYRTGPRARPTPGRARRRPSPPWPRMVRDLRRGPGRNPTGRSRACAPSAAARPGVACRPLRHAGRPGAGSTRSQRSATGRRSAVHQTSCAGHRRLHARRGQGGRADHRGRSPRRALRDLADHLLPGARHLNEGRRLQDDQAHRDAWHGRGVRRRPHGRGEQTTRGRRRSRAGQQTQDGPQAPSGPRPRDGLRTQDRQACWPGRRRPRSPHDRQQQGHARARTHHLSPQDGQTQRPHPRCGGRHRTHPADPGPRHGRRSRDCRSCRAGRRPRCGTGLRAGRHRCRTGPPVDVGHRPS